jgi:hypothetical protein
MSRSRRMGDRLRGLYERSSGRSLGSWCLSRSSLWNGLPRPPKSLPPRPRPIPLPRYEDPVPRLAGSEKVEPAEGGPSREFLRARPTSRSRGGKSRWSRGSRRSRIGERRGGGVGRRSLRSRSKSRSRSRSRSALQELCVFVIGGAGPLLSGGASRRGVGSPLPGKPLPRPSRGVEGAPDGPPGAAPRGASASDFGPRGTSRGGNPFESWLGLTLSLALGGYPPPNVEGLRSRYGGDLSRPFLLLSG